MEKMKTLPLKEAEITFRVNDDTGGDLDRINVLYFDAIATMWGGCRAVGGSLKTTDNAGGSVDLPVITAYIAMQDTPSNCNALYKMALGYKFAAHIRSVTVKFPNGDIREVKGV